MSHRKVKRTRCASRTALVTAVSPAFLAIALPVAAQEAPEAEDMTEVVVTGFRASLADALEKKRASNQIIETITAEDIGKFPDQNVAESLQRLAGVQIDRTNGQGTRVRIRGLEQNVTTLNDDIFVTGLELYTLGEGNQNQLDSLEGIPSELLGGVDVFKSPQANQTEGGLGGIVNLRTRNPLSLEGTTIAGNVRLSDSAESRESVSPVGALVFGHRFSDRFGILATVSYDDQSLNTDVLGGANRGNWRFSGRNDRIAVPENYYAPEYRYVTDRDETRERIGASLSVGFKPTDATELTAEVFHSNLEILTSEASLKFPFATEGGAINTALPFDIDENGVLLNGTIVSNSAESISYVENTEIDSTNAQLRFGIDTGGALKWNFTGAWSQGDMESTAANNDVRYTQYGVRNGTPQGLVPNAAAPANYPFTYDNRDGELPSFALSANPDLVTNPANGFFKSHWVFADTADISNWAASGNLTYTPAFIEGGGVVFSAGVKLSEREVDYSRGRYLADYSGRGELNGDDFGQNWSPFGYFQDGAIGFKSCDSLAGGGAPLGTPGRPNCPVDSRFGASPALITPYQTFLDTSGRVELIDDFWSSGTVGNNQILVQDRDQMENAVAWIQSLYPTTPFSFFEEPLESFVVTEKTTSAYVMADLGDADDRYHVNVGARIVRTQLEVDQNAAVVLPGETAGTRFWGTDSWNGTTRDFETQTNSRTYTDILPSLNFVVSPTDEQKVRFSAARVMARQRLFDLGRGFQTNFTRNATTNLFEFVNGTRGNAELDPFRASQFDVAYEYYFGRQGLVTGGYFWKEVDSFIVIETQPVFVNDQAGGRLGPVATPLNGRGGNIKGFEIGTQYAFEMGLGFNLNYTFSDSESPTFNDFEDNLPIPGVAENSVNAQVYFEKAGFEARLSYSWRDKSFAGNFGFPDVDFSTSPAGTSVTRTLGIWNRDYGQLDAQIGYGFLDGKLGVTLEALNLTNEDQSQYLQFQNLPFAFASGDRRLLLGVRFNFGSN
jgi:iron complex outermembrane recepter protein